MTVQELETVIRKLQAEGKVDSVARKHAIAETPNATPADVEKMIAAQLKGQA
jgi:hypothetical protein